MRTLIFALAAASALYGQAGFGGLGGVGTLSGVGGKIDGSQMSSGRRFTPYVSLLGHYSRTTATETARLPAREISGAMALVGLTGGHTWAHTLLTGGYVGQANYQNVRSAEQLRQSHVAHLAAAHMISPRLTVHFSELAGTAAGGYGVGAGFGGMGGFGNLMNLGVSQFNQSGGVSDPWFGSPAINGAVDMAVTDARTLFSFSSGGLSYQANARWSLAGQGSGVFVRRPGKLTDMNASTAGGQADYRISERTGMNINYSHSWISYPQRFGGVTSQSLGLGLNRLLTPRSRVQIFGGAFDIRSEFIGAVAIDPELAAILGIGLGYETRRIRYHSVVGGMAFSHTWGQNHLGLRYWRGMIPGSDLLLASRRDIGSITLSRSLSPRFNANAAAVGSRSVGMVGVRHRMDNYQVTAGFGMRIAGQLSLNVNAGYRIVEIQNRGRVQGAMATAGLSWIPREWGLSF